MIIIYKKRQAKRGPIQEVIPGAERVESMKILGVTLQSNLSMATHIDKILATSSSSLYALRVLRSHGLQPAALHDVTMATTVAQIIYASPGMVGLHQQERQRQDRPSV